MPNKQKYSVEESPFHTGGSKSTALAPWKLPLIIFCTLLVTIGLMDALIYRNSRIQINKVIGHHFHMTLDALQSNVVTRLDALHTIAVDVATTPRVVAALAGEQEIASRRRQLEEVASELRQVSRLAPGEMGNILIFDAGGIPVMDLQRSVLGDTPWDEARHKTLPAYGSTIRYLLGEPQFYTAVQVIKDSQQLGTCVVTLNMPLLKRQLSDRFSVAPGLNFGLLNDMGAILLSNAAYLPAGEIYPADPQRQAMLEAPDELQQLENGEYFGMSRLIPAYKLTLVISERRESLLAPLIALRNDLLIYSLLALLCSVSLLSWYCYRIVSHAAQYQDRYAKTVEMAGLPTWEWSRSDNRYRFNGYFCNILGLPNVNLTLTPAEMKAMVHPDDLKLLQLSQIRNPSEDAQRIRQELRLRHHDGHWHWIELQGSVFAKGKHTPPVHASGLAVDIHSQRLKAAFATEYRFRLESEVGERTKAIQENEAALRRECAMLRAAMNKNPDVICLRDTEKRLIAANAAFLKFFNITLEQALFKKTYDPIFNSGLSADALSIVNKEDDTVLSTGQPLQIEQGLELADGQTQYFLTTKSILADDNGHRIGFVCNASDITMRKLLEKALEKAREESDLAGKEKNGFLANMSHEIRNPLSGILGLGSMLKRLDLPAEPRHYLDCMEMAAKNLLILVNNLLDYSSLESGRLKEHSLPFALAHSIETVVNAFQDRATRLGIELKFWCSPTVPAWIYADPAIMRQVLTNLIFHALTSTPQGEVNVRLWTAEDNDEPLPSSINRVHRPASGRTQLFISVQEQGAGINPEQHALLFRPLQQSARISLHRYGGAGFGLIIARALVEAMNGRVHVENNPGEGCQLIVELQIVSASQPEKLPSDTDSQDVGAMLRKLHVLVVEDDEINRIVIVEMLHALGCQTSVAKDGDAAVAMSMTLDNSYDVILMDLQMPRMDGYTTTRLMREGGCDLPIVALTASAMPEDHDKTRDAGMQAHVDKPVDPDSLRNALLACLKH